MKDQVDAGRYFDFRSLVSFESVSGAGAVAMVIAYSQRPSEEEKDAEKIKVKRCRRWQSV